jgi:hypothetical protein
VTGARRAQDGVNRRLDEIFIHGDFKFHLA